MLARRGLGGGGGLYGCHPHIKLRGMLNNFRFWSSRCFEQNLWILGRQGLVWRGFHVTNSEKKNGFGYLPGVTKGLSHTLVVFFWGWLQNFHWAYPSGRGLRGNRIICQPRWGSWQKKNVLSSLMLKAFDLPHKGNYPGWIIIITIDGHCPRVELVMNFCKTAFLSLNSSSLAVNNTVFVAL